MIVEKIKNDYFKKNYLQEIKVNDKMFMLNVLSFNEKIIYIGDIMKKLTLLIALSVLLYSATASAMPPKSAVQWTLQVGAETVAAETVAEKAAAIAAAVQRATQRAAAELAGFEAKKVAREELAPLLRERDVADRAFEEASIRLVEIPQADVPAVTAAYREATRREKEIIAIEGVIARVREKHGLSQYPADE